MDVGDPDEFEFREVEGDVFEVAEVDEVKLEAFYLADEALQLAVRTHLAAHVLLAGCAAVVGGQLLALQEQRTSPVLLPDLAAALLLQRVLQWLAV